MKLCVFMNASPLIAAEGYFFCLETKEAKIQVSKKASLRTRPLPCKAGRTTGWNLLPHASPHMPSASAKFPNALATHNPPLFCPFSPEAGLLTGIHSLP
ncbi:hypothetical protein GWR56_14310 [Mucilaginibacter sp. 14171R-50]|uniref:hypothetical protein n=1 Tax=Mucilaginibacter sp. 14171R-50 TaxID=2703789 RepID=UPI00138B7614|nr:hypothetical protein [Mucilaginibacter sp. 14171R-50]QHS56657.1 hypothetical protein GWR56_14310 [Mucilaginibacter sp. 14171R-50]